MSTTTVSYSATAEEIELEELRAREERARQAMLRRLGAARSAVDAAQSRHATVLAALDQARGELPDLFYVAPELPVAPPGEDAAEMEQYVAVLDRIVDATERQARAAIGVARNLLERRRKLAQTWQQIHDVAAALKIGNQSCKDMAARLGETFHAEPGDTPSEDCSLEQAQTALRKLDRVAALLGQRRTALEKRHRVRGQARSSVGARVAATSAASTLGAWSEKQAMAARNSAKNVIEEALRASALDLSQLPQSLRTQIDAAIDEAADVDRTRQVADLVHRHRARLDGVAKAAGLLARPPCYADDSTSAMHTRWRNLVARLQTVLCGHAEWSDSLEMEHCQVQEDCTRAMQRAYAKAHFLESSANAGMQFVGGDGEVTLMNIDDFDGYYIEQRHLPAEEGFGVVSELKKDPGVSADRDAAVTAAVCERLNNMSVSKDAVVDSGIEVLERKKNVTSAKRPELRRARVMAIESE